MVLRRTIGLAPLRDLTIPAEGSMSAARLLSAALRRLLGDLGAVLHPGSGVGDPQLRSDLRRLVLAAKKKSPGAVASALRSADVGVWIRCLRPGAGAEIDRFAGLVCLAWSFGRALSRVGGWPLGCRLRVAGPLPKRLASLAAREVLEIETYIDTEHAQHLKNPGKAENAESMGVLLAGGIEFSEQGLVLLGELAMDPCRGLSSETGQGVAGADRGRYFEIAGAASIVLATIDDNPLANVEAHPDKSGNAVDLGGHPAEEWCAALADALALIGDYLPDLRREIGLYIQQFVPVGAYAERHLSASYREAIGTVYLSLHAKPMTMVEAVIHEFSHNKLNALFEVDAVLNNAFSSVHSSPLRPDLRPLHGVLLAVHAFLPVARLYECMIAAGDPRLGADGADRLRQIIDINHRAAMVIHEHAQPTALGSGLVSEIARWDRHFVGLSS
ncbi:MAG TPA: hypothetical protein ENK31_08660 [Nannocystis exedens]|nr:hypothetical protein [Nannocystis exedens]